MAATWLVDGGGGHRKVQVLQHDAATLEVEIDGVRHRWALRTLPDGRVEARGDEGTRRLRLLREPGAIRVVEGGAQWRCEVEDERAQWLLRAAGGGGGGGEIRASMPGRVVRLPLAIGTIVEPGTVVAVLEAMKMENDVKAPARGVISAVFVAEGDAVEARAPLLRIDVVAADAAGGAPR